MAKRQKKNRNLGTIPGSVKFTGTIKLNDSTVGYLAYNERDLIQRDFDKNKSPKIAEPDDTLTQWYDIRGLHDTSLIQAIGSAYDIHALSLEDAVDVSQRPKYEEYQEGIFITLKAVQFNRQNLEIETEHISLFFGKHYLITFQEHAENALIEIKDRILEGRGRVRTKEADYLAYVIIDVLCDHYFTIMDEIEELINQLEVQLLNDVDAVDKSDIHNIKVVLIEFKKYISPLQEALNKFILSESEYVDPRTIKYVRDTYDHVTQVIELIESSKDTLTGLNDIYHAEISFKMNKIIQFLTIITSVFVPITFLAGIYGMNFTYMPELQHQNGYFILLGVMAATVITILLYFKRKRWL